MTELEAVPAIKYRVPELYDRKRGSGWFWCHRRNGDWAICYINALWGVSLDGVYVSHHNFDDVVGPLFPPSPAAPPETKGSKGASA